jgi:beta-lactam-binding protein with PASTA domain
MPTMPNVVGLGIPAAQAALQSAGVLVLASIGYFDTWPVSVRWAPSANKPGTVTAQSPSNGANVAANAAIVLNVSEFRLGVAYP